MMKEQSRTSQIKIMLQHFHPSAFLLVAQLILLFLYAAFDGIHAGRALISAVGLIVLMLVVWVINRSPGFNLVAWILAIPGFILAILSAVYPNPVLLSWSSLIEGILYFYAAGSLIAYMMEDYQVTVDELYAVGATFTLFAWGFAYLYLVCQTIVPGSFVDVTQTVHSFSFLELLFVSFTNLSASGLSDVLPVTPIARVVMMLEQFVGVGYIAIVVSRLIGLTIMRQKRRHDKDQ